MYMPSLSCPTQLSRLHTVAYWMSLAWPGTSQTAPSCYFLVTPVPFNDISPVRYLGQNPTHCPWLLISGPLAPSPSLSSVSSAPRQLLNLCHPLPGPHCHGSPVPLRPPHSVLPRTAGMTFNNVHQITSLCVLNPRMASHRNLIKSSPGQG